MTTLTLSFAQERARYGKRATAVPSRFLFEAQGEALPAGWVGVEREAAKGDDDEPKLGRRKRTAAAGTAAAGRRPRRSGAKRAR